MAAEKDDNHKRYQKSLIINELLPYSEYLEEEANQLFGEIKLNLSVAVQKRDLWPGALFWTNRLTRYMYILIHVHVHVHVFLTCKLHVHVLHACK